MHITRYFARGARPLRSVKGGARRLAAGWIAGAVFALTLVPAQPASAEPGGEAVGSEAEKLRKLDIMLMVTGLRCRTTTDNFTEDYGRFTSNHLSDLNQAAKDLQAQLSARYGTAGAAKELDRLSVMMANEYGGGHPWLSCAELHQIAKSLAVVQGRATLAEAADQLLDRQPHPLLALAVH
ncbi:S-adenosyl-L-homocysteine hydrolase [Novosphingobium sp.]|uniref:S-adenosyl-L-homocysteine hydrolase n=1 Tax=Novosphingobium sp. TaxID=1874826 RepID=UPI002B47D0AF|nr:S-adenosyl-L-homocysteine hydrolase [Novosphingobium sp.]HKR90733.1 S-adenosyl-L-homocysteine hydrolase [Novosphingobium sp.]